MVLKSILFATPPTASGGKSGNETMGCSAASSRRASENSDLVRVDIKKDGDEYRVSIVRTYSDSQFGMLSMKRVRAMEAQLENLSDVNKDVVRLRAECASRLSLLASMSS